MSFQPVVPFSGYAGWDFLSRTMGRQKAAFAASGDIQRNEDYFREKIGGVKTAENLISDRRLLSVALGAFGLDEDIGNTFFIRKVLEDGALAADALANKLSDKRYLKLTQAFGFDLATPRTVMSDFVDKILTQYEERQFEIGVGNTDNNLRLALALQRDLPELAARESSQTTKWYTIIGSPTMSAVFQTALGLPSSVGALDLDQQVRIYADRAERFYGSADPANLAASDRLEKLTREFLLRSQLNLDAPISSGNAALTLLQGVSAGRLSFLL